MSILGTGSRAALLVLILYFIYIILSHKTINKKIKVITIPAMFCLLLMVFFIIKDSIFFDTLLTRFSNADASLEVRYSSFNFFVYQIENFRILGPGFNNSFAFSEEVGSSTGLENPWLMLLIDTGIIGIASYLLIIFYICRLGYKSKLSSPNQLMIVLGFIFLMLSTFNSFGARTTINVIPWIILGSIFHICFWRKKCI